MWQVRRCSNDRFILKRDRDKHYLRAASSSCCCCCRLATHPKDSVSSPSLYWSVLGEIPFYYCPSPQQTVVVSVGSYDDIFVCFDNGKIPLSWKHAWAARLKAPTGDTCGIKMETRQETTTLRWNLLGGSVTPKCMEAPFRQYKKNWYLKIMT